MSVRVGSARAERISTYERARRRGVQFLLGAIGPDGQVAGAGEWPRITYYRFPWALAVSGETAAAHRVLNWIEKNGLGDDGAFHGGVAWNSEANRAANTYPETCLAYGAQLLRRFDIARRAMNAAARFHDPATGGIFMHREETGKDAPQLLFPTCQFGMSATMEGDMERARSVGHWLERLWNAQPALPDRLYTVWTPIGGLATDIPPGARRAHYVNESQEERQLHYNGGIAAACLTHLYFATGERKWLELAEAFEQFSMESTERQFNTKQVCKSAWGAGLLYLATRDERYLPWLEKMGDWFVAGQDSDGGWSNTPYLDPNPPLENRIEITAEFVVHLDTLIGALATA